MRERFPERPGRVERPYRFWRGEGAGTVRHSCRRLAVGASGRGDTLEGVEVTRQLGLLRGGANGHVDDVGKEHDLLRPGPLALTVAPRWIAGPVAVRADVLHR